jgi:hypothetical protein
VEKFAVPTKGRGLETIGSDRVKQATEEVRRIKADYISLIEEFADKVRKFASPILLGGPETELASAVEP